MKLPEIVSITKPEAPSVDAYRILKSKVEIISTGKNIKIIMVTSAGFREGKTVTALNLAVLMAQSGKKTVIIDCHQRKPDIHKFFKLSNEVGLSDIFLDNKSFGDTVQNTSEKDLYVLTAGKFYSNPSKLIDSPFFNSFLKELKNDFDYIILDTPPMLIGADTQILSQYVDGCVFVVATRSMERETVIEAKELLEKLNVNILGVALTKVDISTKKYYKYYKKNRV